MLDIYVKARCKSLKTPPPSGEESGMTALILLTSSDTLSRNSPAMLRPGTRSAGVPAMLPAFVSAARARAWISDLVLEGNALMSSYFITRVVGDETRQDNIRLSSCCTVSVLLFKSALSKNDLVADDLPPPPLPLTTSGNFQSLHATSLHNERSGFFFPAALLQLKPVRMLDCSASALVSRLSDVKQLDGPSGHLLLS